MAQACSKCSHVNPSDAIYCFYDGVLLSGHSANGGPVNAGAAPFPAPFVFPTGQSCQNFDQLALACQQNWSTALNLLKQGFLVGFFGGLGRADLAMAAQEASQNPDLNRGLDTLLGKMPTQALESPKLRVEPAEVNLGVVPMGTDRSFEMTLHNQGMRLLHGTVASDSKWLTIGEAPGQDQKLFQFTDEATIQVHIRGQHLRAGHKALVGQLLIQYNGEQQTTVKVRLEVPIKPFPEGVLAGSTTPKQLAEKAKAAPKEAAVLFQNGAVAKWFSDNGLTYPVQGPSASGLGAVQQFFEALGLVKAPKVIIDPHSLTLQGNPGEVKHDVLKVSTAEKRYVYAHATSEQSWVDVSQTKLDGNHGTVTVVTTIPDRPGETLTAKIRVAANGNQRFDIPVQVQILGTRRVSTAPAASALSSPAEPALALEDDGNPFADMDAAAPAAIETGFAAAADEQPFASFAAVEAPAVAATAEPTVAPSSYSARKNKPAQSPLWMHLLPAALLLLALLVTIIYDFTVSGSASGSADAIPIDSVPRVYVDYDNPLFYSKAEGKGLGRTMSFGIRASTEPDMPASNPNSKRLTYKQYGTTNNALVMVDDNQKNSYRIGDDKTGYWEGKPNRFHSEFGKGKNGKPLYDTEALWVIEKKNIQVTQKVAYLPGEPIIEDGVYKRLIDTVLVRYELKNLDKAAHKVGLRFLLDTLIGSNDGVPFLLPGSAALVTEPQDFSSPDAVPDFIQAYENADLRKPGVVAQLNLKVGGKVEPPARVRLTRWPGAAGFPGAKKEPRGKKKTREATVNDWDIPPASFMDQPADSAIVMYWDEKELAPGETRVVGFSYGLGSLAAGSGKLALTVGGNMSLGGELTVVGLVNEPQPNQKLTLVLPPGLSLIGGSAAEQAVPAAGDKKRPSPVTWRVRAEQPGNFTIKVESSDGEVLERKITIRSTSLF